MAAAAGSAILAATILAGARAPAQQFVPTADPEHPRIRYADSLLSLNDRCAVRQGKLNPAFRPVYVNGKPIGFC